MGKKTKGAVPKNCLQLDLPWTKLALGGMLTRLDEAEALTSVRHHTQIRAARANRTRRTTHALPNLRGVHTKLCQRAAEGIAVHAEFFGGFALVAAMARQYFKDETLLELAHRICVRQTNGVHSKDKVFQLAFHSLPSLRLIFISSVRREP